MKNIFYILIPLLLLLFLGCEGEEKPHISTNNILKNNHQEVQHLTSQKQIAKESISKTTKTVKPKEYLFHFEDLEKHRSKLMVKNDIYNFSNIKQPIILVNLFSTWCPPCRGQIPHLSNLQHKFKKNLFILSALVYDDISDKELKRFIIAQKVKFYISKNQKENLRFAQLITPKLGLSKDDFPLPLMILFVNGKYFTHYEGIMPEEMIESDIKQLLEKIKK